MGVKQETTASLKQRVREAKVRVKARESDVYVLGTTYDQTVVKQFVMAGTLSTVSGALIGWIGVGTPVAVVVCALTGLCASVLAMCSILLGTHHRAVREVLERYEEDEEVHTRLAEKYEARPIEERLPEVPIIWTKTSKKAGCFRSGGGGRNQKYRYADLDKAKAEADRLNRKFKIEFGVYNCVKCGAYHIGRNPVER